MKPDVYERTSELGFSKVMGAEVIDEWETGCRIRSEARLETPPGTNYYVVEGGNLVAVSLKEPDGQGPFDYSVEKDRSDIRSLPEFEARDR